MDGIGEGKHLFDHFILSLLFFKGLQALHSALLFQTVTLLIVAIKVRVQSSRKPTAAGTWGWERHAKKSPALLQGFQPFLSLGLCLSS